MSEHKECCGGHCRGINMEETTGHKLNLVDDEGLEQKFQELYAEANKEPEAPYQPTEQEEEELEKRFFCLYHLKMQFSEYEMLTPFERDWVIQRFIHQKNMEKEIMSQQQQRSSGGIFIPRGPVEL